MKKVCAMLLNALVLVLGSGCGRVESSPVFENRYSREAVTYMIDDMDAGYRPMEDVEIALAYVYQNEEVKEKCGEDFELEPSNVSLVGEGERCLLGYKGTTTVRFEIGECVYKVRVSKDYHDKWKVVEAWFEEQE